MTRAVALGLASVAALCFSLLSAVPVSATVAWTPIASYDYAYGPATGLGVDAADPPGRFDSDLIRGRWRRAEKGGDDAPSP